MSKSKSLADSTAWLVVRYAPSNWTPATRPALNDRIGDLELPPSVEQSCHTTPLLVSVTCPGETVRRPYLPRNTASANAGFRVSGNGYPGFRPHARSSVLEPGREVRPDRFLLVGQLLHGSMTLALVAGSSNRVPGLSSWGNAGTSGGWQAVRRRATHVPSMPGKRVDVSRSFRRDQVSNGWQKCR